MAGMSSDVELLKDIPGYKAILKSVLKSQIQMLVEQLSEHTGEETMILTASIHDGTLSHQGSYTGKGFLEGRDEIKSQFLGFCLKSHHKKKSSDTRSSPYQRPQTSVQGGRTTPTQGPVKKVPRLQVQPVSLQRVVSGDSTTGSALRPPDMQRAPSQVFSESGQERSGVSVKLESSESCVTSGDSENYASTSVTFPSSIHQSHTLTAGDLPSENNESQNSTEEYTEHGSENDDSTAASTCIKIEPITENEMELEITGVEPGKVTSQSDSWSHGQSSFGATPSSGAVDASSFSEASDSSYSNIALVINPDWESLIGSGLSEVLFTSAVPSQLYFKPFQWNDLGCSDAEGTDRYKWAVTTLKVPDYTNYPIEEPIVQRRPYRRKNSYPKPAMFKMTMPTGSTIQTEHGEWKYLRKSYSCPFCEKNWRTPSLLQRHLLTHTGERPHICVECGQSFKQKAHLDGHYVRSHKEKLITNEDENDSENSTHVT